MDDAESPPPSVAALGGAASHGGQARLALGRTPEPRCVIHIDMDCFYCVRRRPGRKDFPTRVARD